MRCDAAGHGWSSEWGAVRSSRPWLEQRMGCGAKQQVQQSSRHLRRGFSGPPFTRGIPFANVLCAATNPACSLSSLKASMTVNFWQMIEFKRAIESASKASFLFVTSRLSVEDASSSRLSIRNENSRIRNESALLCALLVTRKIRNHPFPVYEITNFPLNSNSKRTIHARESIESNPPARRGRSTPVRRPCKSSALYYA